MKKIRLLIMPIIFSLFSQSAIADGSTQEGKITYLRVTTETIDIDLEGVNPDFGCDNRAYRLYRTHSNYNSISAAILSAHATGSPIKLWVKSCSGSTHPEIVELTQGSI